MITIMIYIILMLFKLVWWAFMIGISIGPIVWFFGRSVSKNMFYYPGENQFVDNSLRVMDGIGCLWISALIIAVYVY